jgi:hypothetical protein
MKKSNIFVYIELSKFTQNLTTNLSFCKEHLKAQASYFQVIPSRYFSAQLNSEWESICQSVSRKGPRFDEKGQIVGNAAVNTIDQMSSMECLAVANRIFMLHDKVKKEFAQF